MHWTHCVHATRRLYTSTLTRIGGEVQIRSNADTPCRTSLKPICCWRTSTKSPRIWHSRSWPSHLCKSQSFSPYYVVRVSVNLFQAPTTLNVYMRSAGVTSVRKYTSHILKLMVRGKRPQRSVVRLFLASRRGGGMSHVQISDHAPYWHEPTVQRNTAAPRPMATLILQ